MVQDDVAIRTPLLLGLGVRIPFAPAASHTNLSIAADLLIERGGGMTGIGSAESRGIRLIWGVLAPGSSQ